jgi:hypothetical protein
MNFEKIFFKKAFALLPLASILFCAHIPSESVQLNQMVGKGIENQNQAYSNLLNEYFDLKKKSIDDFITQTYIPAFLNNLRTKAGKDSAMLIPDTVIAKILKKIDSKRDSMQSALEKVRITILTDAQENAMLLTNANSAVTAILKSAVSVDNATKEALHTADSLTGSKFKFSEFEKTFDKYLLDVGTGTAKTNSLLDQANQILNRGK